MAKKQVSSGSSRAVLKKDAASGAITAHVPRPPNAFFIFKQFAWFLMHVICTDMKPPKKISQFTLETVEWFSQPSNEDTKLALCDSLRQGLEQQDKFGDALWEARKFNKYMAFVTWAGFAWDRAVQEPYMVRQEIVKDLFDIAHPGYKYQPKQTRKKRGHTETLEDSDEAVKPRPAKKARCVAAPTGLATLESGRGEHYTLPASTPTLTPLAPAPALAIQLAHWSPGSSGLSHPWSSATRSPIPTAAPLPVATHLGHDEYYHALSASTSTLAPGISAPAPPPPFAYGSPSSYGSSPSWSSLATPPIPAPVPLPVAAHHGDQALGPWMYDPHAVPMSLAEYPALYHQSPGGDVSLAEPSRQLYPFPALSHNIEPVWDNTKATLTSLPASGFASSPVFEQYGSPGPSTQGTNAWSSGSGIVADEAQLLPDSNLLAQPFIDYAGSRTPVTSADDTSIYSTVPLVPYTLPPICSPLLDVKAFIADFDPHNYDANTSFSEFDWNTDVCDPATAPEHPHGV